MISVNNIISMKYIHMHMRRCASICCSRGLTNEFLVATPLLEQ